jgi:hypothetical protein
MRGASLTDSRTPILPAKLERCHARSVELSKTAKKPPKPAKHDRILARLHGFRRIQERCAAAVVKYQETIRRSPQKFFDSDFSSLYPTGKFRTICRGWPWV